MSRSPPTMLRQAQRYREKRSPYGVGEQHEGRRRPYGTPLYDGRPGRVVENEVDVVAGECGRDMARPRYGRQAVTFYREI